MKREPTSQKIYKYPKKDILEIWQTYQYEFRKTNKFKYIFTIIDHFSKLADSYLLKNKSANEVLNSLKIFCEKYGFPNEFRSHNEHEFVNSSIQNFCK